MQLDLPRTDPPSWLDELQITLLWPDDRWSADGALDVLSASCEFEGWLYDARPYDKRHKAGWLSAIADFESSARQIGPNLLATLGAELCHAATTAESIEAEIGSSGPPALKIRLANRLPADRAIYTKLKSRWTEPAVRSAAWQDFAAACRDETTSYDTLALRRDLFWHLIRAADYDSERMSQLLAGVLTDFGLYVAQARWWLGDITDVRSILPSPIDKPANLSEEQRLTLCERIIIREPIHARRVVWIAFDKAGPGTGVHELGAVAFWDSEWLRAVIEAGSGPNWERLPPELQEHQPLLGPSDLPAGRDILLARVDLGIGAFNDPARLAAEQAESVVALADFHIGDVRWRRLDGYLDFADGRLHSKSTFGAPDRLDDIVAPTYTDYMMAELDRLKPRLAQHLPISDPDLSEVVRAVRWWQQARTQTPLAALLLDVRVLELVASRVGTTWPRYIESYLRTRWIRLSILETLRDVVREAVFSGEHLTSNEHRERVKAHHRAIISFSQGGFTTDPRKCLDALPDLAEMFPIHTRLGRRLHTVNARLASVASLTDWCNELAHEWSQLTGRLLRLRNVLAHGGPFHDEGVASIGRLGQRLAAWSLSLTLESIIEGRSISAAHSEFTQMEAAWWYSCSTALTVARAIFPP